MKLFFRYILVFILILGFACSPPRSRRFSSKSQQRLNIVKSKTIPKRFRSKDRKKTISENIPAKITKQRFSDTIYIDLNKMKNSKLNDIKRKKINNTTKTLVPETIKENDKPIKSLIPDNNIFLYEYKKIIDKFDNDNFNESCPKIQEYARIIPKNDTLKYDAMFYWSECMIQKGKLLKSIEILLSLINNTKTTPSLMEKSLVRIGHVYCLLDDKQTAEMYFNQLRKKFPHSPFLRLANCAVLKK